MTTVEELGARIDRLMLFLRTGEWTGKRIEPMRAIQAGQAPTPSGLLEAMDESSTKWHKTIPIERSIIDDWTPPTMISQTDDDEGEENEDEQYLVVVGEAAVSKPKPEEAEEIAPNAPKEQPRGFQTADEFWSQSDSLEITKSLDRGMAVGVGTVSIIEEAPTIALTPTCFICGKKILENLVTTQENLTRHGTCLPHPLDEQIMAEFRAEEKAT